MANWDINFGFVSGGGTKPDSIIRKIQASSAGFARMIVRDVAISSSERAYKSARQALIGNIRKIVNEEIVTMAKRIGFMGVRDSYRGPYGRINLSSSYRSRQASELGWDGGFNLQSSGIRWDQRTKEYLGRKQREGTAGYWFRRHGGLGDYLQSKNDSYYYSAFGPLQVFFTRTGKSNFDAGNVTSSGRRGRLSETVNIGRLEVVLFGRITPAMMPGLNSLSPDSNPLPNMGVAQLLRDDDQTVKLKQQAAQSMGGNHRPALDPFVSYFLTRRVPNAIWLRTEKFVAREMSLSG